MGWQSGSELGWQSGSELSWQSDGEAARGIKIHRMLVLAKLVARRIERIHWMVVMVSNSSGGRRVDRPTERPSGGGGDGDGNEDDARLEDVSRFCYIRRVCSPYPADIFISSPR